MSNPTDEPIAIESNSEKSSSEGNLVIHDEDAETNNDKAPSDIVQDEKLSNFLKLHNLHKDLYQILCDNDIDLDMLQDTRENEIDDFCDDLKIKGVKRIRFRKLMKIINESETNKKKKHTNSASEEEEKKYGSINNDIDDDEKLKRFLEVNSLPDREQLYKILLSEQMTFDKLHGLYPDDIDNICNNRIKIGAKIEFKKAIEKHQLTIYRKKASEQTKPDHKVKLILIGDSNAGKTALISRYCNNTFSFSMASTFGIGDKMIKRLELGDKSTVQLEIWDTAGQERYHSVCTSYYRRADAILFCYDVTNKDSLDNCIKWRQRIEDYAEDNVIVEFVGCKCDVTECIKIKPNDVDEIIKQKEWKKYNIKAVECSSKTGENVQNVFKTAAELVKEKRKTQNNTVLSSIPRAWDFMVTDMNEHRKNNTSGCC